MESPFAGIGRLGIGDSWVGVARGGDGFRLLFGGSDGRLLVSAADGERRTDELLAAAIAYFEEDLDAPPPEVEATHGDLAELVRWLAGQQTDTARRSLVTEALDAIDDGLAGDVVVARLADARAGSDREADEQADVVDLLVARYRALTAPGG